MSSSRAVDNILVAISPLLKIASEKILFRRSEIFYLPICNKKSLYRSVGWG